MSEANKFFKQFKEGLKGELYTTAIAQIEVYDAVKSKADIKLLPNGELIKAVPVGMPQTGDFMVRMPYKKGDHVLVVFAQREIDSIIYGATEASKRQLSIDDAVVVSGINLFSNDLPTANNDDLVISKKDMSSKIVLDSTGNITVESAGNVYLGTSSATEGVPLGDQLKSWLDGHTHTYDDDNGTTISSKTTSAPDTLSPSPSAGVKVK